MQKTGMPLSEEVNTRTFSGQNIFVNTVKKKKKKICRKFKRDIKKISHKMCIITTMIMQITFK